MKTLKIDSRSLQELLVSLLNIPSPSGYTDQIVHFIGETLHSLDIPYTTTRRGAIRATITGKKRKDSRAIAVHLDTLGAMVSGLKKNGRLAIAPIGNWSSRFAEGSRVTVFSEPGPSRGTVLPLKSSGHAYGDEIDHQPVSWDNIEIRVDEHCENRTQLKKKGFNVGDFVAFDAAPEIIPNGYVNARHLDDKAGVAIILSLLRAIKMQQISIPVTCHFLFTIAEEIGLGASAVLCGDIAEMVVIDNATIAPEQNSREQLVTICMMDNAGPFDYHLTRRLIKLCQDHSIEHRRDVFRHYRSDSASAIVAGHDTRTGLVAFGVDSSHGYERTHMASLTAVAELMSLYVQSPLIFERDRDGLSSLNGFPHQPEREIIQIRT